MHIQQLLVGNDINDSEKLIVLMKPSSHMINALYFS